MPAHSWSRIVCHETEGFRRRRINSLDKINAQCFMQDRQLIDQGDVHVSKHILQHLSRLGNGRTTNSYNLRLENRSVKRGTQPRGLLIHTTYNLRNTPHTKRSIPIIDPLRRIDQREVPSSSIPTTFEERPKNLLSSARIASALNNYQLVIVKLASKAPGDRFQKREIWIPILLQRSWNAYDHDIRPGHSLQHFSEGFDLARAYERG